MGNFAVCNLRRKIFRIIKSRKVSLVENVAHTGKLKIHIKVWFQNLKKKQICEQVLR